MAWEATPSSISPISKFPPPAGAKTWKTSTSPSSSSESPSPTSANETHGPRGHESPGREAPHREASSDHDILFDDLSVPPNPVTGSSSVIIGMQT